MIGAEAHAFKHPQNRFRRIKGCQAGNAVFNGFASDSEAVPCRLLPFCQRIDDELRLPVSNDIKEICTFFADFPDGFNRYGCIS